MFDQVREMFSKKACGAMFDSAAGDAAAQVGALFDPVDERAALADIQSMRGLALQVVLLVADGVQEDAIPEDMLPSEFFDGLMVTGLDSDGDGKVDPLINQHLSAHMADAFSSLGVDDAVISDIMGDDTEAADAALESAAETVISNLPDLGDAMDEFAKQFMYGFDSEQVFSDDEDEKGFDSAKMPRKKARVGSNMVKSVNGKKIRYKGVKVMRNGKATVVNKRVAGQTVKLSAAQRGAMKKLHAKPRTFASMKKAQRSMGKGKKAGLY
jgi:hypothetical protein